MTVFAEHVVDTYALIDSGSEHNIFGLNIARKIGLDLSKADTVTIAGVGREPMPAKVHPA